MQLHGLLVGAAAFIIIGLFHPLVVKGEYYFGVRIWPLFLVLGLASCALSLFVSSPLTGAVLGTFGFSSLWSIGELFHQRDRVAKGWFPRNPARHGDS